MKESTYIQCYCINKEILKKEGKTIHEVLWLPVKYAVAGKKLSLKKKFKWIHGWVVKEVYKEITMKEQELNNRRDDYKKQRKVSDV